MLQRIERTALVAIALLTVVGGALGGWTWAGGIAGGGALAGISYWAIRSSVDVLVLGMGGSGASGSLWRTLPVVIGRHALLAAAAYVIIVRLRLHPIGVLIGASAVVLAAIREAVRGRV